MGFVIFYASAFLFYLAVDRVAAKRRKHLEFTRACSPPQIDLSDIVVHGKDLRLGKEDLHTILTKRYAFYRFLSADVQQLFLHRLATFLQKKIFIIKDDEGFREMPVLVSAAAVHLTLGLRYYLLPFYQYIRIYPEEFFGDNSFKVLAGNVQQNTITVAWNHLLKGNENSTDGANVGLHEMSHALYFQKIVVEENHARTFSKKYNCLLSECREAFDDEMKGRIDLYSNYATTNLQEFWAESVELFFEKPTSLQAQYPRVFEGMKILLNQDR